MDSFNTQPPEGGCVKRLTGRNKELMFQHTAARRRLRITLLDLPDSPRSFNTQPPEGSCVVNINTGEVYCGVSTHSRPKAAA